MRRNINPTPTPTERKMTGYTQEQRQRAAELAKQRAEQAKQERLEKNAATLARNLELRKQMQGQLTPVSAAGGEGR